MSVRRSSSSARRSRARLDPRPRVAIGIAFGWALERAGLGSARKLAGQFYLTDLTVFKVMFSAIVTAMLGVFWLGRLGLLDLARVYVPETFLLPQLVGGLLFGVGFVARRSLSRHVVRRGGDRARRRARGRRRACSPACWSRGLAFRRCERFYESTARGAFTLPHCCTCRTASSSSRSLRWRCLRSRSQRRGGRRARDASDARGARASSSALLARVRGQPVPRGSSADMRALAARGRARGGSRHGARARAAGSRTASPGCACIDLRSPSGVRRRTTSRAPRTDGDREAAHRRASHRTRRRADLRRRRARGAGLGASSRALGHRARLLPARRYRRVDRRRDEPRSTPNASSTRYFGGDRRGRRPARAPDRQHASANMRRRLGSRELLTRGAERGVRRLHRLRRRCARASSRASTPHEHAYLDYTGSALYGDSQIRAHHDLLARRSLRQPAFRAPAPRAPAPDVIDDARATRVLAFLRRRRARRTTSSSPPTPPRRSSSSPRAIRSRPARRASSPPTTTTPSTASASTPRRAGARRALPAARRRAAPRDAGGAPGARADASARTVRLPRAVELLRRPASAGARRRRAQALGYRRAARRRGVRAEPRAQPARHARPTSSRSRSTSCSAIPPASARSSPGARRWRGCAAPGSPAAPSPTPPCTPTRTASAAGHEGFEDGTPTSSASPRWRPASTLLEEVGHDPASPTHVTQLPSQLLSELTALRHANGAPLVRVYGPATCRRRGGTIAFNLCDREGEADPLLASSKPRATRPTSPSAAAASATPARRSRAGPRPRPHRRLPRHPRPRLHRRPLLRLPRLPCRRGTSLLRTGEQRRRHPPCHRALRDVQGVARISDTKRSGASSHVRFLIRRGPTTSSHVRFFDTKRSHDLLICQIL